MGNANWRPRFYALAFVTLTGSLCMSASSSTGVRPGKAGAFATGFAFASTSSYVSDWTSIGLFFVASRNSTLIGRVKEKPFPVWLS